MINTCASLAGSYSLWSFITSLAWGIFVFSLVCRGSFLRAEYGLAFALDCLPASHSLLGQLQAVLFLLGMSFAFEACCQSLSGRLVGQACACTTAQCLAASHRGDPQLCRQETWAEWTHACPGHSLPWQGGPWQQRCWAVPATWSPRVIDMTKMATTGAKMAATEPTTAPQQRAHPTHPGSSPSHWLGHQQLHSRLAMPAVHLRSTRAAAAGEGGVRGHRHPRASSGLSDHWGEGSFHLAGSPGSGRPSVVLK